MSSVLPRVPITPIKCISLDLHFKTNSSTGMKKSFGLIIELRQLNKFFISLIILFRMESMTDFLGTRLHSGFHTEKTERGDRIATPTMIIKYNYYYHGWSTAPERISFSKIFFLVCMYDNENQMRLPNGRKSARSGAVFLTVLTF